MIDKTKLRAGTPQKEGPDRDARKMVEEDRTPIVSSQAPLRVHVTDKDTASALPIFVTHNILWHARYRTYKQ